MKVAGAQVQCTLFIPTKGEEMEGEKTKSLAHFEFKHLRLVKNTHTIG